MPADPRGTWVRVKDKSTGHEFDVAPKAYDRNPDLYELVTRGDYAEPFYGREPRPAKHAVAALRKTSTSKEG